MGSIREKRKTFYRILNEYLFLNKQVSEDTLISTYKVSHNEYRNFVRKYFSNIKAKEKRKEKYEILKAYDEYEERFDVDEIIRFFIDKNCLTYPTFVEFNLDDECFKKVRELYIFRNKTIAIEYFNPYLEILFVEEYKKNFIELDELCLKYDIEREFFIECIRRYVCFKREYADEMFYSNMELSEEEKSCIHPKCKHGFSYDVMLQYQIVDGYFNSKIFKVDLANRLNISFEQLQKYVCSYLAYVGDYQVLTFRKETQMMNAVMHNEINTPYAERLKKKVKEIKLYISSDKTLFEYCKEQSINSSEFMKDVEFCKKDLYHFYNKTIKYINKMEEQDKNRIKTIVDFVNDSFENGITIFKDEVAEDESITLKSKKIDFTLYDFYLNIKEISHTKLIEKLKEHEFQDEAKKYRKFLDTLPKKMGKYRSSQVLATKVRGRNITISQNREVMAHLKDNNIPDYMICLEEACERFLDGLI